MRGAAGATVISQIASCVYLFSTYLRGKSHIPLRRTNFGIRFKVLGEAAILRTPAFIQSTGMALPVLVINNSLEFYSADTAITTYGMTSKIVMLVIMPILGIVQGFQPVAGYDYCARNVDRVRSSLKTTLATAFIISLFGYAFMMLLPRVAMGFFTRDAALMDSSARVLRIIVLFIPLAAIQITGFVYFQAIGKRTKVSAARPLQAIHCPYTARARIADLHWRAGYMAGLPAGGPAGFEPDHNIAAAGSTQPGRQARGYAGLTIRRRRPECRPFPPDGSNR